MIMESNKISRKCVKEFDETKEHDSEEDRISCLPDSILNHIQSFLYTEDIIRTSFLSKRWNSLWSPLSYLDMDFFSFSKDSCLDNQTTRFAQFVNRLIVLHKDRSFSDVRLVIHIHDFENESNDIAQIDNWVKFMMGSDSKMLHLDLWGERDEHDPEFWNRNVYSLPQCSSFPHRSLETLVLTHCVFRPSQYMRFFSLKIAFLTTVRLPEESVSELITASPCLESLFLNRCVVPVYFKVHVPETKLERLVVESCFGFDSEDIRSFEINVPSLLYFRFEGDIIDIFTLNCPKNLIEAELNFVNDFTHMQQHIMLRNLLKDIANVESLILSQTCLKVLNPEPIVDPTLTLLIAKQHEWLPTPPLPNLKHLTLKEVLLGADDIMVIACFLRTSPCLETLSIDFYWPYGNLHNLCISGKFDDSGEKLYSFMFPCDCLHSLKKVVIKGFEGRKHEMTLIKAILMNSLSLKVMVIYKEAMKSRYAKLKLTGNKRELKLLKAHQEKTTENLLALRRGSRLAELVMLPSP